MKPVLKTQYFYHELFKSMMTVHHSPAHTLRLITLAPLKNTTTSSLWQP